MKQKTLIALIAALCLLSSVGPIQVFAESGSGSNNGSDDSSYDDSNDDNDEDSDDEEDESEDDNDDNSDDGSDGDDDSDRRHWFESLRSHVIEEKRDERREAIKAKLFDDGPHTRFDEKVRGPFMQIAARTEMMSAKLAMFHARLDNILIRIQTNIDAAEDAGKDVSGAQTELDAAKSDLKQAQTLMAKVAQARTDAQLDIKAEIEDNDSDSDLKDIVKETVDEIRPEIKSDMEKIRDLMKSAHLHMIASIKTLKSL